MKAFTILVACVVAAAVASVPADAAKRKKRMAAAPAAAASTNPNENSARLVRDALPVFLPGGGLIAAEQARQKAPARKRKARR